MLILVHANTGAHCWGIKQNNEVLSSWGSFLKTVQMLRRSGCNTDLRVFHKGDRTLSFSRSSSDSSANEVEKLQFFCLVQGLFHLNLSYLETQSPPLPGGPTLEKLAHECCNGTHGSWKNMAQHTLGHRLRIWNLSSLQGWFRPGR